MTMIRGRFAAASICLVTTVTGAALGAVIGSQPATARITATVNSPGANLNVRTGPARWYPRVGRLTHGTPVNPTCQEKGEYVAGSERNTDLWDRLPDGTYIHDGHVKRSGSLPMCAAASTAPHIEWTHPLPGFKVQGGFRTPQRPTHRGVDLMSFKGTPIHAAAQGTIVEVVCNIQPGGSCDVDGTPQSRGCGWYVKIAHPGKVATLYCHMIAKPPVVAGQKVKAGQVIGYIGSSGRSSYPHLHYEVHVNAPPTSDAAAVDPIQFMGTVGAPMPRA
jgi:murein DD-endopeptidase MepM/ murein hydrolase activator NlpD